MPDEIEALLSSHPQLTRVTVDRVLPEHQIRFDALRGEPRNADLAIAAHDATGPLAITVEGKADESFDRPVRVVLEAAVDRIATDKSTGAVKRVQTLAAITVECPSLPRGTSRVFSTYSVARVTLESGGVLTSAR